ncbi:MAG: hypothetical protein OEV44_03220 [Spirochaetota bacterium]|nr:hypothetical protein [Spirochaetota bacterium]
MKKLILIIFLLILPIFLLSYGEKEFKGKYKLHLSGYPNSGYQNHFIEIKSISGKKITGIVGLDFSIGPQARMPMPWEKLHELKFNGKYNSLKRMISFSIDLHRGANTLKHTFKGYLTYIANQKVIIGIYKINKKEEGGFYAQEN